jgi:two-component system chemotaxis sensor kinase CheA
VVPEELLERFRKLSLERIGRVEAVWNLVQNLDEPESTREMFRDVHTLKGDSAIVGFREVHGLCQKLEDLITLADELHYEVSDDLELVVTMAIQFIGMLLRNKSGSLMTGLDLDGFVRQVDEVLRESRTLPSSPRGRARRTSSRGATTEPLVDRLSDPTRQRLGAVATTVFLEYLGARGATSRSRLRGAWQTLKQEIWRMQATSLRPLMEHHANGARELATQLGKRISIQLELDEVQVDPRVADAIDAAVVHVMRNAIDHGIELPAVRKLAGKPEDGVLRIRTSAANGSIEISIEDDGSGIDLAAVRTKGIERGLLDRSRAAVATETELLDLVFQPGFSTRSKVTEVSGRGVGMDAVRAAVMRVGGSVRIKTSSAGSAIALTVPAPVRTLHVYQFLAPGGTVALAVSARWTPSIEAIPSRDAIDPLHTIQLFGSGRQTSVPLQTPVRDLGLRLRWGFLEVNLRAATEPCLATAERICPTPDDHPVEVIAIDGQETLLLRPEHVSELAAAWAGANLAAQ